jgi:hypothetical protein
MLGTAVQNANTINIVVTVVTSAAVGAVVSSISVLIGQMLERRARRREIILSKAIELALRRTDLEMELFERVGGPTRPREYSEVAAEYYRVVEHLFDTGRLPH